MIKQIKHIAFIPDGNRRWAEKNNCTKLDGHKMGYKIVKDTALRCFDKGIEEVTFWAFSTDNWKREKMEVKYLMNLLLHVLRNEINFFIDNEIKLKIIGIKDGLSKQVIKEISIAENKTENFTKGVVNLCFNYGGRSEIVELVKSIMRKDIAVDDITHKIIENNLLSGSISDIDMIVRTSGERRLSGFQPWKGSYSEMLFVDKYWPDFNEDDLDAVIETFYSRNRRFGGDHKNNS